MFVLRKSTAAVLILPIILFVFGCNPLVEGGGRDTTAGGKEGMDNPDDTPRYIEKGDLDLISQRGMLRILVAVQPAAGRLPRRGFPNEMEVQSATDFARSLNLKPSLVYIDRWDKLVDSLLAGKGDIIAAGLSVTEARKKKVEFTVPLAIVKEQVIVAANNFDISGIEDLAGKRIAIRPSSSYWETMQKIAEKRPGIEFQAVDEGMDTEEIVARVASGYYQATLCDSNLFNAIDSYRDDVKVAFSLPGERAIAWAVRPDSEKLADSLNRYLNTEKLAGTEPDLFWTDLPDIKKRKTLRVLTRNSAASYFLRRGELMGFEYELARDFAKKHGLRLEMIVPPSRKELIPWLVQGKGDIVAASLTITAGRRKSEMTAFSRPYNYVSEVVVARADDIGVNTLADLAGRTLVVRKSSSYWENLEELKSQGASFKLVAAAEDLETEEIIAKVASGQYDLTVADSHILNIELTLRKDIRAAFSIGEALGHGWLVRKNNVRLLSAINDYFDSTYRSAKYNMIVQKYFSSPRKVRHRVRFQASRSGELTPYDGLIKKYAEIYGFDWRLIAAQMYMESRFDPRAVSFAGAVGLMQVLPRTARQMGFSNPQSPESNIHAGVKYLDYLRNNLDESLSVKDRTWLTLAAYNAGYGHVIDARRLAGQLAKNPNRWFDHVEQAMLLLSRPHYASRARYGYVRGSEPVHYVREINRHYQAFIKVAEK